MVPSDPYHGGGRTSLRPRQRHRTAVTTHIVSASRAQATTGKAAQAPKSRYQTRELLGRGGMSEVYRGFDLELRRPVAIKRLRPDLGNNPGFRARFRREAQAAGRLSHSAIVAVFDTGEERDETGSTIPFIVMELVEGGSLCDALRQAGRLPPRRALEVTSGVLDALACSHAAGIIHRDIKPANVMLTGAGGVKVADFGVARPVSDTSGTVTLAGTVVGTPQYLSPEQGRGGTVDARSDIYSVGCMLYELLVGEPPFTGDSPVSIVVQHVSDAPARPSAANGDISTDIDSIVLKALAKDPSGRYQTASEMKADVERVLGGHQPAAATALLEEAVAGSPEVLGSRYRDSAPMECGSRVRDHDRRPRHSKRLRIRWVPIRPTCDRRTEHHRRSCCAGPGQGRRRESAAQCSSGATVRVRYTARTSHPSAPWSSRAPTGERPQPSTAPWLS